MPYRPGLMAADLESTARSIERSSERNPTIDSLKGVLIVLVMIGHLFIQGQREVPVKWGIYGFHMPLFLGLSGLLFGLESLRRLTPAQVAGKYWRRMIWAWLIAFIVYTPMNMDRFDVPALISAIVRPKIHLWYVPALCFFIAAAYVFRVSRTGLFALSLCTGVAWMLVYGVGSFEGPLFTLPLPDPRFLTMAPFFFFGMVIAKRPAAAWFLPLILACIGMVAWMICFYIPSGAYQVPVFVVTNLALIALLPRLISMRIDIPVLTAVGADSLFFYLWHLMIIFAGQRWIYPKLDTPVAFSITLVLTIALLFAVRAIARRTTWLAQALGITARAG